MTRLSSPRISTLRALTGATVVAAAVTVAIPVAAQAAVACNETALIAAINAANSAGGGNVVLTSGCTYTLTTSHATGANGADGLPIITTVMTLTGNANVIERSTAGGTPAFRIAEVASTGKLTVKLTTLRNGSAVGSGGGILNFGEFTLTGGALTGNSATGQGGALYNGLRGSLTATSSPISSNSSAAQGAGIAAISSTATTLSSTPVSANATSFGLGAGGVFRTNGVMTITTSSITGNTPTNCVGSSPAVPGCVG